MIERIVATTNDGAAQAGLQAAKILGLPTATSDLASCVSGSQATILFASSRVNPDLECNAIRKACSDLKRPILVIPAWTASVPPVGHVAGLIRKYGFKCLNVAGSRGSSDPAVEGVAGSGIYAFTLCYVTCLLEILREDQ